jgi:predicted PurR-regulated permease PerM
VLLVPVYVFFFLLEIDPMLARARRWIPTASRSRVEKLAREMHQILSAFFRGRLLVCIVKGALTGIGLQLTGVPYGFLVGFAAGFLSLIPYLGVWLAAIPALGMCWFENHELVLLLATAGVFVLMEAVEGFVLIPRLLGDEVGLHPVTVIVTFLIFARWFGVIGMLLSVPMAAIAITLAREFLVPVLKEEGLAEPPPPDSPAP